MTSIGLACSFILLSSGCDETGASPGGRPASTATTGEEVGTTVIEDEACTFIAPYALDAWAAIDADRGLVVQAQVVSADPPVNATASKAAVTDAHRPGLPWGVIGAQLGMTRQGARQRFDRIIEH